MPESAGNPAHGLSAARAGLSEALGEVLETFRAFLLHVAQQELDPALLAKGGASDLVQQTMLDALRDFERFKGQSAEELRAWLHRLLLNNLVDFARLYRGTGKRQIDRECRLPAQDSPLAAAGPSPSSQAIGHEQQQAIQQALVRLPADYQRVLELRFQDECSFEEIGRVMQLSPNAARKLWTRAVKRLQQETEGTA